MGSRPANTDVNSEASVELRASSWWSHAVTNRGDHGLEYFPANLMVVVPGQPPRPHSPRQPTTLYLGLFGGGLQSFSLP